MLSQMRYVGYGLGQTFPPKSKFSTDQIPDLTGKVILVTGKLTSGPHLRSLRVLTPSNIGGNTGVGKETVKVSSTEPTIAMRLSMIVLALIGVVSAQCQGLPRGEEQGEGRERYRGTEGSHGQGGNLARARLGQSQVGSQSRPGVPQQGKGAAYPLQQCVNALLLDAA